MTTTIRGIVRGGKIEPLDKLDVEDGTEVDISVPVKPHAPTSMATFGMFTGPIEQMSTEVDFRDARRSIWGNSDGK
jgi:hypothetical protein